MDENNSNKTLKTVWKMTAERLGVCLRADILMATVAINILGLALPIVILQCYDRIIPNAGIKTLDILVLGLCICLLLDTVLRIARVSMMNRLGAQFEHNAMLLAMNSILRSKLTDFEQRRHSDYLERLRAVENIREIQFGQNILSLIDLPFILLFLGLIWFFTGWLVVVPVVLFVCFGWYSLYMSKRLYEALIEKDITEEVRHNFLLEILQGMQTLKPLAMENQMVRRYERLQGRSARAIYELSNVNNTIQASTSTMSQISMVVFVAVGAIPATSGDITMGALAAGSLLSGRILQPASKALSFFMQWQTSKLYEEKVSGLLELTPEFEGDSEEKQPYDQNSIWQVKELTFTYPGAAQPVIEGLNLTVQAKEMVCIVGENGCGKTTLARLLVGLLDPTKGEILYGNITHENIDKEILRKKVAFVPQRGVLFNGTILENLTAFKKGSYVQEALDISAKIGLNDAIMRLMDGLSTNLDSSLSDNLPEGLRQRITMVRSMIGSSDVIIYDDSNAGYDPENLKRLCDYFKSLRGKKTLIIFTNSDELVSISDCCYKMADKKLTRLFSRLDENQAKKSVTLDANSHPSIVGGSYDGTC